jgi:hypothetical protein
MGALRDKFGFKIFSIERRIPDRFAAAGGEATGRNRGKPF